MGGWLVVAFTLVADSADTVMESEASDTPDIETSALEGGREPPFDTNSISDINDEPTPASALNLFDGKLSLSKIETGERARLLELWPSDLAAGLILEAKPFPFATLERVVFVVFFLAGP